MSGKVHHFDLYGLRKDKYEWLHENDIESTDFDAVEPTSPHYRFVASDSKLMAEYEKWPKINDIFPANSVGIVTARDSLTIRWTKDEVWDIVRDFSGLPEEKAREKYNLGKDVKDWKVKLAQEDVKKSGPEIERIVPILYRPFDIRHTYYTGKTRGFICRPRSEIMRHMLAGENMAIISARSNKSQQQDQFFSTRLIMEAKCGESTTQSCIFPLYLYPDPRKPAGKIEKWPRGKDGRVPNLAPEFIGELETKLGLNFARNAAVPAANKAGGDADATGYAGGAGYAGGDACVTGDAGGDAGATEGKGTLRKRSRGRLPHFEADDATYFVTFRLADSLPRHIVASYQEQREKLLRNVKEKKGFLTPKEKKLLRDLFSEKIEAYLDKGKGECYLERPEIAELVENALRYFDGERYHLYTWCIMPNHAHVVLKVMPGHDLSDILHSWKSFTSHEVKRRFAIKGKFWQREYYDHIIRDEEEFYRVIEYVFYNPEKAGIRNWKWRNAAVPAANKAGGDADATGYAGGDAGATGDAGAAFGPKDVFNYIYAVFHSPTYRERYAEFLKIDFPRVPLTSNVELFRELCSKGEALVGLHLMESPLLSDLITHYPVKGDNLVEKGHPRYLRPGEPEPGTGKPLEEGRVYISKDNAKTGRKGQYFEGVPPEVWEFHIGGYQVCEKWLKDRRGRELTYDDLNRYQKIVVAIKETIRLMGEIDELIDEHGGWPIG